MMPEADENELRVNIELPAGTKIEITSDLAARIESILRREVPEMEHMPVEVGGGGFIPIFQHAPAEVRVKLVEKQVRRKRTSQEMAQRAPAESQHCSPD